MTTFIKNDLLLEHVFDKKTKRHYLNGFLSVLHCHHYASLYTQLAIDAGESVLLKECSRETFSEVLASYFDNNVIDSIEKRIGIACQYFSAMGLGKMEVSFLGDESGEVVVSASHIDSGWMKKWGEYDKPVNYIGAGYIEAMFESVLDAPQNTFNAEEVQSIVTGAETSIFKVTRK
jgi:predicted hydrocarbon binding protein